MVDPNDLSGIPEEPENDQEAVQHKALEDLAHQRLHDARVARASRVQYAQGIKTWVKATLTYLVNTIRS